MKAAKNLRDHGVSFEKAKEVFSDPNQVTSRNYHIQDQGEQRFGIIGLTFELILVMAVYVQIRSRCRDHPHHLREKGRQI